MVNADSQQLYEGLRLLSARPSAEDEAQVPHALFGLADAATAWSTGQWLRAAQQLLQSDARPLIFVGGTGLYFHALLNGLSDIPPVPDAVRETVAAALEAGGERAFRARLAAVDPGAEARIGPSDRQRLTRAMAVFEATGRSLSDWQSAPGRSVLAGLDVERAVLERPREELYARCDARVDAMIRSGAVDEVRALLDRRLDPDLPAMKAVGVREIARFLDGLCTLDDAVNAMKASTRQYAKRQLTWFRNQTPDWPRLDPE